MSKSFSEEFKDQKINDLLEDYIALENKIDHVVNNLIIAIESTPEKIDSFLSTKILKIIDSAFEINKEIENSKEEIRNLADKYQSEVSKHVIMTLSGIQKSVDQITQDYEIKINAITNAAKPFSAGKAITVSVLCTLFLSFTFSGAAYLVTQSQKDSELQFYSQGYTDMHTLVEKTINQLPKPQQNTAKAELESIDSRK